MTLMLKIARLNKCSKRFGENSSPSKKMHKNNNINNPYLHIPPIHINRATSTWLKILLKLLAVILQDKIR